MDHNIKFKIAIPIDKNRPDYREVKGKLFEALVSRFLQLQSYSVKERVRDVGTEIDLKCVNTLTGDVAIVECKARAELVQTEAVNKIHTDVSVGDANHGWLFAISDIGKEADARLAKLNEKIHRQMYRFFPPHELVKIIVEAKRFELPDLSDDARTTEVFLCLFEGQEIWAVPMWTPGHELKGLLAWGANDAHPIEPKNLPDLSITDFPYPEAAWLDRTTVDGPQSRDIQPVVEVIAGEEWSDYRPSRPVDFVGRQQLIRDIREFLGKIKSGNTSSRLFGIKGQSGWGKSSLALKLAHELRKDGIYILPVDCRAAKTSYYADLAISRALQWAEKYISPGPLFRSTLRVETNPFEDSSVQDLLRQAQAQNMLVCVIYDQFEEIIHKSELNATFARMRELALAADEARTSFAVGFSWKTDGTVGSDYPGYHLWHSLSDRRKDFVIDRFTRDDADEFIVLAQRDSKQSLHRNIIKFIVENYAGYPWLLKKLVRYYIEDSRHGREPGLLGSLPSLESLFQTDLQELTQAQQRAVKFIANNSPVEYGATADKYGADNVASLINQRVVINTGGKLNLYWDIFRQYILYEEVPQIPNTYVPTISVRRIRGVIKSILSSGRVKYDDFAEGLNLSLATTDNAVRDLVNMGIVRSNRLEQYFERTCENSIDATTKISDFLQSHCIFVKTKEIIEGQGRASISEICSASQREYEFIAIDEKTLQQYTRKILAYCCHFGLLGKERGMFVPADRVHDILDSSGRVARISEADIFRAPAPPERVVELLELLRAGVVKRKGDAEGLGLRNAIFAASTLGLISQQRGELTLSSSATGRGDVREFVRQSVLKVEPFSNSRAELDQPDLSADEVGSIIADLYGLNWSTGSCRRYGSAVKRWLRWIE
ncbi:MAG: AAA family ATPase [Roseiarcus sp.]|jgi:hypothetical protein